MLWNLCFASQGFSAQVFKWQYVCLHWQFHRNMGCGAKKRSANARLVGKLYRMAGAAIEKGDEKVAFQTLEMLKLSFGEKMDFSRGAGRLTALCVMALQKKQYAAAGYVLDAFKPFVKNAERTEIKEILRGIVLIISSAKKISEEYVLNKAADCAFLAIEQLEPAEGEDIALAVGALKTIGLNAVKLQDEALFRQTAAALLKFPPPKEEARCGQLSLLIGVWLHQLVKRDAAAMLPGFFRLLESLAAGENGGCIAACISRESGNLVGIIGVNHKMQCKAALIRFMLAMAGEKGGSMRRVAYNIGRMARITVSLHGLRHGFDVLLPLLETGRMYMDKELRFVRLSSEVHLKGLYAVLNELALSLELIARQDGKITATDALLSFREYWLARYKQEQGQKSVSQFCQLLLKRLVTDRKRRIRNLCLGGRQLLANHLFDDSQIKKLGLG